MTDIVSSTYRPPMIGSSRWVLVTRARVASAVPMASEPVSPMKISAGAALNQRNPAQAASMATATTAMSSGWDTA